MFEDVWVVYVCQRQWHKVRETICEKIVTRFTVKYAHILFSQKNSPIAIKSGDGKIARNGGTDTDINNNVNHTRIIHHTHTHTRNTCTAKYWKEPQKGWQALCMPLKYTHFSLLKSQKRAKTLYYMETLKMLRNILCYRVHTQHYPAWFSVC